MKRLIYVLVVIFLCVGLLFGGYLAWRFLQAGEKPVATIVSPETPTILESGDEVYISVFAKAEAGISRIVLMADGEIYAAESVSGENTLMVTFPWYATSLGSHTLEALVYDSVNQASEPASLLIGVQAQSEKKNLDFIYIPPASSGDGGDGTSDGNGGTGAGSADAAVGQILPVGDDGEILGEPLSPDEIGGQDDIPTLDENDLAGNPLTDEDINALQDSQDGIPIIAVFEANPRRVGQSIQIAYHVEATDDLEVERVNILFENAETGEFSATASFCSQPSCTADDTYALVYEGTWFVSVVAIDSSGQTSERLVKLVEVVGTDNALLPAIVVHDPARIVDLFDERVQDNEFDLGDLWIDEILEEEEACYTMSVEQQENGNLVTMTYNCTINSPSEDFHYSFVIRRENPNDPRRHMIFQEFYPDKKIIEAGESFSFLDENANCGANVEYTAYGLWVRDDEPRAWVDEVGSGKKSIVVADCTSEDLQITDFAVEANSLGTATLTWNIAQNPNWPSGDNSFDIVRYQPPRGQGDILAHEALFKGEWVQAESMDFTRFDQDIVCDTDYFYTLNLYKGPFSEPENHLATAHTQLADFNCSDRVVDIGLELTPGYIYDTALVPGWERAERPRPLALPAIQSAVILPSNFAWPEGNEYEFVLQVNPLDTLAGQPSNHWTEYNIRVNEYTPRKLAHNTTRVLCGGIEYTFRVYLFVDGMQRNNSQPTTLKSPPCLPTYDMIPDITQLAANNCGDAYCIDIRTSAVSLESRDPDLEYFDIDAVTIFREIGVRSFAFGDVPEEMDPDQLAELPLIFGQPKVIDANLLCSPVADDNLKFKYRIAGGTTSDRGHILYGAYGDSRGYIAVPTCGETYNEVETVQ